MPHDKDDMRAAFVAGFRAGRVKGEYDRPLADISERTAANLFERYYAGHHGEE